MSGDQSRVRTVLEGVRATGRHVLTAPEAREVCEAYDLPVPKEGLARSIEEAVRLARDVGFPVALKIASPDIVHKTEAGGVHLALNNAREVRQAYRTITANAWNYKPDAVITGVQVQQMVTSGSEVIVGMIRDPAFGPVVMFGLGGVLVEALQDTTFRLAPTTQSEALQMLGEIRGAAILRGVRGLPAANQQALSALVVKVSQLAADFPEISEVDLNPVMASASGVIAVDARLVVDFAAKPQLHRHASWEMRAAMRRILMPDAIAVIGASPEPGKIGYAVMENIVSGGYEGRLYPINPRASVILGRACYPSVKDIPGLVDIAIFCIPARLVAQVLEECGEKGIRGAVLIPSGFAEIGDDQLQQEVVDTARKHNIRLMGPNIYGFYYTPHKLCATFCTPYSERGTVALTSQSGGVGMAIIGFSRSNKMGVSAIIGLGNKSDIDEDDLLTFFEDDPNTQVIAMHIEDLKDGRAFAEVAQRVTKQKPVVVLKAGRTDMGARAAKSHTGALAGNDRIYDGVLRQAGVIRARHLNEMLEFAKALQMLPTPRGENVLIVTGAGGSGVLLSDACVDYGLHLMSMPPDLDQAFRQFIPPFGAAGNPVDITGGEPPETYRRTISLALYDPRIHALILGYWHTIITPPMTFANLLVDVVQEARRQGIDKPVVVSLVGDVAVEVAARHLQDHRILAYPYETEKPVAGLGAKYRWARNAGLLSPASC
jgi:acetyl coenzyme A synthetase (ADP forming)-like protein